MAILVDGFSTTIDFGGVQFCEKSLTPPGYDGRDGIDVTCMRNVNWITMVPKQLLKMTPMTIVVSWDTEVYGFNLGNELVMQNNDLFIITFPDQSTVQFYGWIDKFQPGEFKEGEQPTATLTIVPSMLQITYVDGVVCAMVEVDPFYSPGPC